MYREVCGLCVWCPCMWAGCQDVTLLPPLLPPKHPAQHCGEQETGRRLRRGVSSHWPNNANTMRYWAAVLWYEPRNMSHMQGAEAEPQCSDNEQKSRACSNMWWILTDGSFWGTNVRIDECCKLCPVPSRKQSGRVKSLVSTSLSSLCDVSLMIWCLKRRPTHHLTSPTSSAEQSCGRCVKEHWSVSEWGLTLVQNSGPAFSSAPEPQRVCVHHCSAKTLQSHHSAGVPPWVSRNQLAFTISQTQV